MAIDTDTVATTVGVRRLTVRIGAELSGLNLRHVTDTQIAEVRAALLANRVVFIRRQDLGAREQIEFARLELTYTLTSKRKLLELVEKGHVSGWDDPRMPTLAGLRRRGIPPGAIRNFAKSVGVARDNSTVDVGMFEHAVRDELNRAAPRHGWASKGWRTAPGSAPGRRRSTGPGPRRW